MYSYDAKLNFRHHDSSHQCRMILQKSFMLICYSKNISSYYYYYQDGNSCAA